MTFQEMFENAKKALLKAKKIDAAEHIAVQVNVTGEGSGIFYVEAADGKLNVEPYTYDDKDAVMTADSAELLNALKTADTAALQIEGNEEKIAAFRLILESLPKPRKTAATKTTAAKKTTTTKASAAKAEAAPAAKTATKTTTKKASAEEPKTTVKATAEKKTATKTTKTATATKKTTKK